TLKEIIFLSGYTGYADCMVTLSTRQDDYDTGSTSRAEMSETRHVDCDTIIRDFNFIGDASGESNVIRGSAFGTHQKSGLQLLLLNY
ncbi:733_t:CDS:2, partial [Acaulospora morrowiae]